VYERVVRDRAAQDAQPERRATRIEQHARTLLHAWRKAHDEGCAMHDACAARTQRERIGAAGKQRDRYVRAGVAGAYRHRLQEAGVRYLSVVDAVHVQARAARAAPRSRAPRAPSASCPARAARRSPSRRLSTTSTRKSWSLKLAGANAVGCSSASVCATSERGQLGLRRATLRQQQRCREPRATNPECFASTQAPAAILSPAWTLVHAFAPRSGAAQMAGARASERSMLRAAACHPAVLFTSLLGAAAVMAWRIRETSRPITAPKIVIPPLGMSTGFIMFAYPPARIPLSWALCAFCRRRAPCSVTR